MAYPVSIKGVLLIGGKVVLVRNARAEWELPGGRLDPGEAPEQTLAREFEEELAVRVDAAAIIDSYLFDVTSTDRVFIVTYGCRLLGRFEPKVSHEHSECGLHALPDLGRIPLPAGYARSIHAWSKRAEA